MKRNKLVFREERLSQIHQLIQTNTSMTVAELAELFDISESTVRLDLAELEKKDLITRTHGGAISKQNGIGSSYVQSVSIQKRVNYLKEEKDAIGRKAASLINDGDTILIDGGSTTPYVIKHLGAKKNLTIITNSLLLIQDLINNPNINLFILGGLAFSKHGVTVGDLTNNSLSYFYPNKTIIGIDGFSVERGIMAADAAVPAVAAVKAEMVRTSNQLIIVSDHTKYNKICPMPIAPIEAVDILVTDSKLPQKARQAISAKGPKVLIADE